MSSNENSHRIENFNSCDSRTKPKGRYEIDIIKVKKDAKSVKWIELDEIPESEREILDSVFESNPQWVNSKPDVLIELLDDYKYIHSESHDSSRFYEFKIFENNVSRPPILSFEGELIDKVIEKNDPAIISFTLENNGSQQIETHRIQPWPFGVPIARSNHGEENIIELWNSSYIDVFGVGKYDSVHDELYTAEYSESQMGSLSPRDAVTIQYELPVSQIQNTGEFEITDYISYDTNDCRLEELQYKVSFDIV